MRLGDVGALPTTLDVDQVSDLWGCSAWATYKMVREGTCPVAPLRLGRRLVWPTAAVLRSIGLGAASNGEGPPFAGGPSEVSRLDASRNGDRGSRG